jgi:hypothetical protein
MEEGLLIDDLCIYYLPFTFYLLLPALNPELETLNSHIQSFRKNHANK